MYSVQLTLEVLGSKAATRGRRQCSVQLTLAVLGSTAATMQGEKAVQCTAHSRGVIYRKYSFPQLQ